MINGRIISVIPVVKQQATLYFLEKGTNQFELSLADDNGVLRTLYSGAGGGGTGTASPQTLSQVLTAGNDLDGKEIVGDLVVKDGDTTTDNYTLSAKKESLRYEGYKQNGETYDLHVSKDGLIYSSNVEVNGNHMDASFRADSKGIDFNTDASGHVVGAGFKANTEGVLYQAWGSDSNGLTLALNNAEFKVELNQTGGNADTLSLDINAGLSSSKYYEPTKDEQYVQKKYVDSLLGGGKIDVTVDRMYLTYAGKLAVDITVNGLAGNKVTDPNLFDHSTFRMRANHGASNPQALLTFGPTGNATIEKTYMYANTGTVKAHIESSLNPGMLNSWGEPRPSMDIFNQTQGFFVYIPEAGMSPNQGVRSRMTNYGEVYDKRQSGVVNFKLQDGKQSTLIPSTEEYKFFAFDADTFKAEDPVDSKYSYLINNGIPIGSQDVQSGYILSDNRIMPNPTPNQVTEWELTFKVSGENASVLVGGYGHRAVVYDAENNLIDEVYIDAYSNSNNEVTSVRAKLTTINKFKNIVGDKRGFKFGIKINSEYADGGIKFELVNIKRTSRALV